MSPEQIRGDAVDQRTDIFSFGALLHEMLTGRHPFDARSSLSRMSAILTADPPVLSSKAGSIPPELEHIVCKALAKEPMDRFQNMADVLTGLYAVRDYEPEKIPPVPETGPRIRPEPRWWPAVALFFLIICAVVAFILARA
jgi:serine/threonine-protein kinase